MRILEWPGAARDLRHPIPARLFGGAVAPLADRKQEAGNRTGETKGQTTKRTAEEPFIAALRP